MKFQDMPYERVNMNDVEQKMKELISRLQNAQSGEEQFEIHKEYYKLSDRIMTEVTIANIRHDSNTIDEFYKAEKEYIDEMYEDADKIRLKANLYDKIKDVISEEMNYS